MHSYEYYSGLFRDPVSRRSFLKLGTMAVAFTLLPGPLRANCGDEGLPEKALSFHNTHTGEYMNRVYWRKGAYLREALEEINLVLRDHRAEKVKPIDIELLDVLFNLREKLGTQEPFHVISGYRSPKTNAALRRVRRGTARHSLHMAGKAVDVRLPGCDTRLLGRAAWRLQCGGVGYYPKADFVHVDSGRVRCWGSVKKLVEPA